MPSTPIAFSSHDHSACADAVLERADAFCREAGLRLTPVRRRTLEILLEAHCAQGAYDILARLREDGFGSQPPIVYRALDFLVEHGLAHRIRRLNAFAACMHPGEDHTPVFFICRDCDAVAETSAPAMEAAMDETAGGIGFQVERINLEAVGVCPCCAVA